MDVDTLDDVDLNGVDLVSDNPNDWVVPKSVRRHDTFLDWWVELRRSDDLRHRSGLSKDQFELLCWMHDQYRELHLTTPHTVVEMSKIRSVIRGILQQDLTIEQTAIFLHCTPSDVVRMLFVAPQMPLVEVNRRLWLERLLREGVSDPAAAKVVDLSLHEVFSFRKSLGIAAVNDRSFPVAVRERAIELRAEGMMPAQIAKVLAADGHNVSRLTISQWWTRHRRDKERVA